MRNFVPKFGVQIKEVKFEAQFTLKIPFYSLNLFQVPNIRRVLEFAVNLEGDTDTIGSMACALAGSYYTDKEFMSNNLYKHMESNEEIIQLADQLFKASRPTNLQGVD